MNAANSAPCCGCCTHNQHRLATVARDSLGQREGLRTPCSSGWHWRASLHAIAHRDSAAMTSFACVPRKRPSGQALKGKRRTATRTYLSSATNSGNACLMLLPSTLCFRLGWRIGGKHVERPEAPSRSRCASRMPSTKPRTKRNVTLVQPLTSWQRQAVAVATVKGWLSYSYIRGWC